LKRRAQPVGFNPNLNTALREVIAVDAGSPNQVEASPFD